MSAALNIEAVGLEQVVEHFRELGGAVRRALEAAVYGEALEMVRIVKEEKLSGQVLGQGRPPRLRNAVHAEMLDAGPDAVMAAVGVNLADARYARFWEYGFTGTEQVREHLRTLSQVFGRPVEPHQVTVRAHSRNVNQPARSYLRSTLAEQESRIRAKLAAAVAGATQGGAGA